MSGEVVTYERTVVPSGQVTQYQEQQRLAPYTPQQRQTLAILETAKHIEKLTDRDGLVSYHAFPANLASGYSLPAMPAGTRVQPGEMYKNLSVFRAVGLTQDIVNRLVLEYGRQWG
jgi:hypothetical protein